MSEAIRLKIGPRGLQKMMWHRAAWQALGSDVSMQVYATQDDAADIFHQAVAWLEEFETQVSRFRPDSQVSRWNRGEIQQMDGLAQEALAASRWAADLTGGLLDPMIGTQMQQAGYGDSRSGIEAEISWELAWQQPTHIAQPREEKTWQLESLPRGYQYDPGGAGKGLAADLLMEKFAGRARALLIDLGGDLRIHSQEDLPAFPVGLVDPRSGGEWHTLQMHSGAVATSSFCRRLWLDKDGKPRHHLLSPRDGQPVWNEWAGVVALAPTALEAETRAKWALLSASTEPLIHGGFLYPADPKLSAREVGLKA